MPINITMPALSPTMEEGNLAKWLVKEGDTVKAGDVIAEIETDKATMEVEAVDEGKIGKIVVPEGTEGVKVNAVIAILAGEGEDAGAAAQGGEAAPAKAEATKADSTKAEPAKADAPKAEAVKAEKPAAAAANGHDSGDRVFASPLGPPHRQGCRCRRRRCPAPARMAVSSRLMSRRPPSPAAAAPPLLQQAAPAPRRSLPPPPKAMSDDAVLKLFEQGSYELVPHDNMRKTIARRLVEAKSTIPHFYLTLDCELDALLALRSQLNAAAPMKKTDKGEVPAYKLSVNDMVIKAMALALRDVPAANASWTDQAPTWFCTNMPMSALRCPFRAG